MTISIHALLAESDYLINTYHRIFGISIHALLAESDLYGCYSLRHSAPFLSTLSLRRATAYTAQFAYNSIISIHALLAESDYFPSSYLVWDAKFLSTLSLRRATHTPRSVAPLQGISIHALLAESDTSLGDLFQCQDTISIHALLAESDCSFCPADSQGRHFYPRSPCGERPHLIHARNFGHFISIHALLAESDPGPKVMTPERYYFYPRSPCGERRRRPGGPFRLMLFLSTLSLRRATAALSGGTLSDVDFYPRSPCGERQSAG